MKRIIFPAIVCACLALGWVFGLKPWINAGVAGANYMAKGICSCVFVAERDLQTCTTDYPPDLQNLIDVDIVNWSARKEMTIGGEARQLEASEKIVATSMFAGLIRAQASYTDGLGCQISEP